MKQFTESELWAFVNRADTHEKIETAKVFLGKLPYLSIDLYDDLMNTLAYLSRELYWLEREARREYGATNPWAAPGMSTRDFIR